MSDIDIFYQMGDSHKISTEKFENEKSLTDIGPGGNQYDGNWEILTEKGYKGSKGFMRTIYPTLNPPHCDLYLQKQRENKVISSDRIIVKKVFVWFMEHCEY